MKNARVLMFGWEFPPHISGGLGTACLGIAQGLAKNGVQVLFVMPKASGDEDSSVAKIINASDVEMLQDLIMAAVNEGMRQIDAIAENEMGKVTGGLNIPGLGL